MSQAARIVAHRVVDSYDMPRLPAYSAAGPRRVCCCCLLLSVCALAVVPGVALLSGAGAATPAATLLRVAAASLPSNASDLSAEPAAARKLERAALRMRQLAAENSGRASATALGEQALRESDPWWSAGVHANNNNPLMIDVAHTVGWLVNRARAQR